MRSWGPSSFSTQIFGAAWVARDGRPFSIFEDNWLPNFGEGIAPKYQTISRITVQRRVQEAKKSRGV